MGNLSSNSDWELHLHTIEHMISYFHASRHFPFDKSAQIYLQDIKELKTKMDSVEYKKFADNRYFTARRTNQYFAGISTDKTIEQTFLSI